ncbi:MAG: GtrA family protein [Nevskia sp.]|nr:GtrA family protein [Nevskia sp.]
MTKLAQLLPRILRFGAVGAAATAIHAGVYLALAGHFLPALQANAAGFATAFAVSFAGHRYWTFAGRGAQWGRSLSRFLATAMLGFGSNSLITWTLVTRMGLPPASALPGIVLLTPALVFACSNWWAFAQPAPPGGGPMGNGG